MGSLLQAFVDALCPALRHQADDRVAARLAEILAEAARAHPDLRVGDHELAGELGTRLRASEPLDVQLERVRGGDLALAVACASGDGDAIETFERVLAEDLERIVTRYQSPGHSRDDLRQILREHLFVGERAKIRDYRGQGFLQNWLRVVAVRCIIDLERRKDRARESPAPEEAVLALPDPADLELDLVKREYRAHLRAALTAAAAALPAGDRHLLREHLVGGLTIDVIAATYGIHRATAARRLARARGRLIDDTRQELRQRLALPEAELDDIMALVVSRFELSVRQLLATPAPVRAP